MKHCRYCGQDLPLDSFSKRKASPDGLAYKCRECDRAYRLGRGKGVYKKLRRNSYEKNIESERAKALSYYRNNREHCITRHAEYKLATSEQQKEYRRLTRAQIRARVVKYRAALEERTPMWLTETDFKVIEALYIEREKVQAETGIDHHVDHIIPLRGETVSGLHVPANLRIIPAVENLAKGNKYES